jgi:hypothetical protein
MTTDDSQQTVKIAGHEIPIAKIESISYKVGGYVVHISKDGEASKKIGFARDGDEE